MREFVEIKTFVGGTQGFLIVPVELIESVSLDYGSSGTLFTLTYKGYTITVWDHAVAEQNYKVCSEALLGEGK